MSLLVSELNEGRSLMSLLTYHTELSGVTQVTNRQVITLWEAKEKNRAKKSTTCMHARDEPANAGQTKQQNVGFMATSDYQYIMKLF